MVCMFGCVHAFLCTVFFFQMLLQCSHVLKAIKWELLVVDEAHRWVSSPTAIGGAPRVLCVTLAKGVSVCVELSNIG